MSEPTSSCCDCEWHAKANHIHVCSQGIQVTPELLCGDEHCHQWQLLNVERRVKRDAEIAAQVKPPEPTKTNWQRIEQAILVDLEQNPGSWRRGYLSGYPVDDDRMYRRHGDRIPHPMRNERIPYRVPQHDIPTLGELADVQRNLPDPNRYSGEEIFYEIARYELDPRRAERLRLRFVKVAIFYNGERFFRWGYQGQILMDSHSHGEMIEQFEEERRWTATDLMYLRNGERARLREQEARFLVEENPNLDPPSIQS